MQEARHRREERLYDELRLASRLLRQCMPMAFQLNWVRSWWMWIQARLSFKRWEPLKCQPLVDHAAEAVSALAILKGSISQEATQRYGDALQALVTSTDSDKARLNEYIAATKAVMDEVEAKARAMGGPAVALASSNDPQIGRSIAKVLRHIGGEEPQPVLSRLRHAAVGGQLIQPLPYSGRIVPPPPELPVLSNQVEDAVLDPMRKLLETRVWYTQLTHASAPLTTVRSPLARGRRRTSTGRPRLYPEIRNS